MLTASAYSIIYVSISSQINIPGRTKQNRKARQNVLHLFSFIASFYLEPQADPLCVAIISSGLTQCTLD